MRKSKKNISKKLHFDEKAVHLRSKTEVFSISLNYLSYEKN